MTKEIHKDAALKFNMVALHKYVVYQPLFMCEELEDKEHYDEYEKLNVDTINSQTSYSTEHFHMGWNTQHADLIAIPCADADYLKESLQNAILSFVMREFKGASMSRNINGEYIVYKGLD